jgi:L-amino acid N-acyltransferase YncA
MGDSIRIRPATETDAIALLAIYRPFVEASVVSFETVTPSVEEFCESNA